VVSVRNAYTGLPCKRGRADKTRKRCNEREHETFGTKKEDDMNHSYRPPEYFNGYLCLPMLLYWQPSLW